MSHTPTKLKFENKPNRNNPVDFSQLKTPMVFACFGVVCAITALFMGLDVGKSKKIILKDTPQLVGPIEVKERNTVYSAEIHQRARNSGEWYNISGEVLDSNKNFLFSFNDELWTETGRDSEGPWKESRDYYNLKTTFQKPGNYYFRFSRETNASSFSRNDAKIVLTKKRGSSIPMTILAVLSFIVAIFFLFRFHQSAGENS